MSLPERFLEMLSESKDIDWGKLLKLVIASLKNKISGFDYTETQENLIIYLKEDKSVAEIAPDTMLDYKPKGVVTMTVKDNALRIQARYAIMNNADATRTINYIPPLGINIEQIRDVIVEKFITLAKSLELI